jgi:hypothetical protein
MDRRKFFAAVGAVLAAPAVVAAESTVIKRPGLQEFPPVEGLVGWHNEGEGRHFHYETRKAHCVNQFASDTLTENPKADQIMLVLGSPDAHMWNPNNKARVRVTWIKEQGKWYTDGKLATFTIGTRLQ